MKHLVLMLMLATTVLVTSCGGRKPGPVITDPVEQQVQDFIDLLEYQSGDFGIKVLKYPDETLTEGFVVVEDSFGNIYAYDLAEYQMGMSWSQYVSTYEFDPVFVDDYYQDTFTGEWFYEGEGYYWDGGYAGRLIFEETEDGVKDLEKVGAVKEAYKRHQVSQVLAEQFGLSEERSTQVAKMVTNWQAVSKSRAMTAADANAFSQELLGVNVNDAISAYTKSIEGDSSALESLIDKAAEVNGTSPEHMNQIVSELLK